MEGEKMFDLSAKFNEFYNNYVVLPQVEQNNLSEKKKLNLTRINEGLKEYNEENSTSYSVKEVHVQGSVEMSTVVQNEKDDYDIDVALVFESLDFMGKGARSVKNIVRDALIKKTKQFNVEPEVKTSCVRVHYAEGYHVDFAIYKRKYDSFENKWIYEHAGLDWNERDINGLSEWFTIQNNSSDKKLRKIVRLSKMFCKSRECWKSMPSGLLQTVLCNENLIQQYNRIDELFYYTMKAIVSRLERDVMVFAPVDNQRNLTPRKSDIKQMINWRNRLKSKLEDLEILFREDCTLEEAIQAWYGFFNHDYWRSKIDIGQRLGNHQNDHILSFNDTEQFIEDMYPVRLLYTCKLSCNVGGDGFRTKNIKIFLDMFKKYLPHNIQIYCSLEKTNCPDPYKVFWKIKNVGPEAEKRNEIRGQIIKKGKKIVEHTQFQGNHYIECYIVKDNVCVARNRINIPIARG